MRKVCRTLSAFMGSFFILIIILAYSQYLTLKKTLIARISDRATALIGQKVELGDIYLDPTAGITIADIVIRNPEDFGEGDLLRVNKVNLGLRYRELFHGTFSFKSIRVVSPELSLVSDGERLNISNTFREFFSKKGTAEYQIDDFSITNAGLSFNHEPLYRINNMNLFLKNLSSASGIKTTFRAALTYLGSNSLTAEGWAYLKDEAKKLSVSVRSSDIDLAIFREKMAAYGMDFEKSRADLIISAEGDSEQGITLKSDAEVKGRGFFIFSKNDARTIALNIEAVLDIKKESLIISRAQIRTGEESSIQAEGSMKNIFHDPTYAAEIRIKKLDLAAFNSMPQRKAGGIITSEPIAVTGNLSSMVPDAKGVVTITDGFLSLDRAELMTMNGTISFSSGKEISAKVEAVGKILKADKMLFSQPVPVKLMAEAKGRKEKISLASRLNISDIGFELDKKIFRAVNISASYDGILQGSVLSGNVSVDAKGLSYDTYKTDLFKTAFGFDYGKSRTTVNNLRMRSDIFSAAGDMISVAQSQREGDRVIEAKNLSASYPGEKAAIKGLDFRAAIREGNSSMAGDISFLAEQVSWRGISSDRIAGKGSIADGEFMLDIPSAPVFDGTTKISAKGKTGSFPIELNVTAKQINLTPASEAAGSFFGSPYTASGEAEIISFDGIVKSKEEILGRAALKARNLSITDSDKKAFIKDAAVTSEIVFRGLNLDMKAEVSRPGLNIAVSGSADRFLAEDRVVRLNIFLPETKLEDMRAAIWDVVPDRILYAGLQGSFAVNLQSAYSRHGLTADGTIVMKDISLEGENREYFIGPVNGMLPVHFNSADKGSNSDTLSMYERTDFDRLKKTHSESKNISGSEIRIGSISYGFSLLEDISLWVEQKGSALKINRFSAKMFQGRVYGTAFIESTDGFIYRAGLIADRVSLSALCEEIPPIKGYISGKIDGVAAIKGDAAGIDKIVGKADFWTYTAEGEKTRISREFLEKIGGPQVKAYLGERPFSKGIMGLYIQNGFLIFRELEISNRNLLGITDLSVKVAPLNNRISIDHLLWTIIEAAQRAKKE